MNRRLFVLLLAAALAWPCMSTAQLAKVPTVGVLVLGNPEPDPFLQVFRDGLRELGYVEGENIRLQVRSAERRAELMPARAAELVEAKVDIIVAYQTVPATAAKRATSAIPIVMAGAGDPVGTGLVASMARPGGNVTGTSTGAAEIAGKGVGLIREALPQARRIAVLANETDPYTSPYLEQIRIAAQALGMDVEPVMSRPGQALAPAFEIISSKGVDAVMFQASLLNKEMVELAVRHRLPSFAPARSGPLAGGLMSYSGSFDAVHREAAVYVDKILKGANPGDLPVALPSRFDLVINLKTAKTLGLIIPESLLARADEVIE